MDKNKFMRSVRLKESACQGCINCIKHCPTQAIRVHNGKAHIIDKFCIDCGRCIQSCPHHAKIAVYDPLSVINNFKYTVALPAPSLYAQYNNLTNVDIVLNALLRLGFDDVYEVSAAAELVHDLGARFLLDVAMQAGTLIAGLAQRFAEFIDHLLRVAEDHAQRGPVHFQQHFERQVLLALGHFIIRLCDRIDGALRGIDLYADGIILELLGDL